MLRDKIITAAKNMVELYELSGGVSHNVEKGTFREFFLAELIRPCIPSHFGVGSGIVVDAYGRQSKQSDIVIYDRRKMPPIMLRGDGGIFPIDNVLVVIEVKSILTASHYPTLVDAGQHFSPKNMDGTDNPDCLRIAIPGELNGSRAIYPLYAVFGYTADAALDEFERLEEQVPGGRHYIKLIGVLNKGVWSTNGGACLNDDIGENAVRFLALALNKLEDTAKSRGDFRLQDWLLK